MFCDVHSAKGLNPGVDCSMAVFPSGGKGGETGGGGAEGVEEMGFAEKALEGEVVFESGSGVFVVGFGWGGFGRTF